MVVVRRTRMYIRFKAKSYSNVYVNVFLCVYLIYWVGTYNACIMLLRFPNSRELDIKASKVLDFF